MDIYTKEKRSELMRLVKNKNTNIELIIRKELFKRGHRYRIISSLFGKPDIVFPRRKLVVFCDGDFWHGKNFKKEKKNYKKFWVDKIKNNMIRDKIVTERLKNEGWRVLRFWKTDILKNRELCLETIEKILNNN